jgi:hypothetical protein
MTDLIAIQKIAGWDKLKTLVLDNAVVRFIVQDEDVRRSNPPGRKRVSRKGSDD